MEERTVSDGEVSVEGKYTLLSMIPDKGYAYLASMPSIAYVGHQNVVT